jgi:RimJ/RimL family protein N-acetyltransferase
MASLPIHATQHLTRLTTAARLARMRPAQPVEVAAPGVFITERLIMRPLFWTDREAYIGAVRASRADLDRYCPIHEEGELDDELFNRQMRLARAAEATCRALRLVAEERAHPGRIVGVFNLNEVDYRLESRAEAMLWVRSDAAGSGFASEGLRALLKQAFAPRWASRDEQNPVPAGLGLSRVDSFVSPENTACLGLIKRLGFVPDPGRAPQELLLRGTRVVHQPFVCFAQVHGRPATQPVIAPGISIDRSISSLLSIECPAPSEN